MGIANVRHLLNRNKRLAHFRSYSYYIEVSVDQTDWVRVIDHTKYYCRAWQFLYFKERVVRYIRIVGTYNTVNKVFHVVSFEAMYTNNMVTLQDGLIGEDSVGCGMNESDVPIGLFICCSSAQRKRRDN